MTEPAEIATPRLLLRPYQTSDHTDFIALFTDPEVTRYTDGPLPLDRAESLFAGILRTDHPRVLVAWAVTERSGFMVLLHL